MSEAGFTKDGQGFFVDARGDRFFVDFAVQAASEIDFVRGRPGPALCEDLAVCYWAGKPLEVDYFNVQQRSRREPWRVDALVRRLDAREFAVAEVQDDDRSLGPRFVDALRRNYRVDHESQWGVFWVPR